MGSNPTSDTRRFCTHISFEPQLGGLLISLALLTLSIENHYSHEGFDDFLSSFFVVITTLRFFSESARIAWPSGLRRWFKAPVTSVAWVRIPPLSNLFSLEKEIAKQYEKSLF